jgi:predicted metal-dependent hydrolase
MSIPNPAEIAPTPRQTSASFDSPQPPLLNVRRMKFDWTRGVPRYWNHDSPALTHYFTALSLLFPEGEKYFVDSVRVYQSRIRSPELARRVEDFARQEAQHAMQHRRYNRWISPREGGLDDYERGVKRILDFTRRVCSNRLNLSITIALEHFTAILAEQLLSQPRYSDGVHPDIKSLWLWHAAEEIEHKSVAFDVYQELEGSYWHRVFPMARMMIGFPLTIHFIQLSLLFFDWKDGERDVDQPPITWRDFFFSIRFIWGREGFMRAIWPELKAYYRRDFHPWQNDNRDLIDAAAPIFGHYETEPVSG